MKLIQAQLRAPNFGDDLSGWMWPRLVPEVFDDDESTLVLGIGSIISHRFDGPGRKIVMGAGFAADYGRLPDLSGGDWRFYFVRGPHTATALGLASDLGIGDAAILLRTLLPAPSGGQAVSFMPHWESLDWGYWPEVCDRAGVSLIDPRWPVERVLAALAASQRVLCEAMHGAVVADALRIPWVAMRPLEPRHRAKWGDWAAALDLSLAPCPLLPSSPTELIPRLTRRLDILDASRTVMDAPPLAPLKAATIRLAACGLRAAATSPGRLSDQARLDDATDHMLQAVARFRADRQAGRI